MELNLPANEHFRISNLPSYKQISGKSVKEMDFCVVEPPNQSTGCYNKVIAIELKESYNSETEEQYTDLTAKKIVSNLLCNLEAKAWHTVNYLFSSQQLSLDDLETLKTSISQTKPEIRLYFVIKVKPNSNLKPLNDWLKIKLRALAALHNIHTIQVMSHISATKHTTLQKYF